MFHKTLKYFPIKSELLLFYVDIFPNYLIIVTNLDGDSNKAWNVLLSVHF